MKYISLLLLCIACLSCHKQPALPDEEAGVCGVVYLPDYFAFGTAYGQCGGNCATFYKIENGLLYADDMDYYTDGAFTFQQQPLGNDKYLIAKKAQEDFPANDFGKGQTFGCPDCHDQGGYYIEYARQGNTQRWQIDTDVDEQPAAIRPYMVELNSILQQLK